MSREGILYGMNPEHLAGVHAKLAWARHHFNVMDAEIEAWLRDEGHRVIYQHNEDGDQHYLTAEFGSMPKLDRWPLLVGDCVTNLRDTLDHLIYAIAHLPDSPKPEKAEAAAFVITLTPENFKKAAKSKLCSVPEAVKEAVLQVQPFSRHPEPLLPPLLGLLAELANGSKHKLLNVVNVVPQNMDVEFTFSRRFDAPIVRALHRKGLLHGRPFFVLETPIPDPGCKLHHADVRWGGAIAHKPLEGDTSPDSDFTAYRPLLEKLFAEVEYIITTISALA